MAFIFKQKRRKNGRVAQSECWYVRFKPPGASKSVTFKGYPDKTATEQLAARLVKESSLHAEGMGPPPCVRKGGEPLADLLVKFGESLAGNTAEHVAARMMHCRTVTASLKWTLARDLNADKLSEWLNGFRTRRSSRTVHHWLTSLKHFAGWLVPKYLTASPFASLSECVTAQAHPRRVLELRELLRLFKRAGTAALVYRGLVGTDRAMLYRTAAGTGLRASELRELLPESFTFGDIATVALPGQFTKNGDAVRQPIAPGLTKILKPWIVGRVGPLWPGTWNKRCSEMLQLDLAAAGIPYKTPMGYYDFHALRSQFVTDLGRAGVPLQAAQKLARHKDPKLTAAIYSRFNLGDLAAEVRKLAS